MGKGVSAWVEVRWEGRGERSGETRWQGMHEPELFPPEPGRGIAGAVAVGQHMLLVSESVNMSVIVYVINDRTDKNCLPGVGVSKALGIVIGILIS